jgi:hypothetical protein
MMTQISQGQKRSSKRGTRPYINFKGGLTMSGYTEMKKFFLGELKDAKAEYEAANMEVNKLEALQGISNLLTLLHQTETLINAELINVAQIEVEKK